jgi:hypothetical protein
MKEKDFMFKPNRNAQNRRSNKHKKYLKLSEKAIETFRASLNFDRHGICCSETRGVESSELTNVTVPEKYLLSSKILEMYRKLGADSFRIQFSCHFPRATRYVSSGARLYVPFGNCSGVYGIPIDTLSTEEPIYRTLFVPQRFFAESFKPMKGDPDYPDLFVGGPSRDNPDGRFTKHEPYSPWLIDTNPLIETIWDFLNDPKLKKEKETHKYNPHIYLEGSGPVLRRTDLLDTEFMYRCKTFFEDNKEIIFTIDKKSKEGEEDNRRISKAFEETVDFIYCQGTDRETRSLICVKGLAAVEPTFTLKFMPVIFTDIHTRAKDPLVTGALMARLFTDEAGIKYLTDKLDRDIDKFITHLGEKVKENLKKTT